ncbi:pyridoxamine 5'-phosphate oxidase family protein [Halorubellus sp. JP-L1]|uniref:pyridoxamine 5'-phosphate oxidase family protein n=1 Tax=Halorubellus sp. JP-L1 TaxID=2715753 RepID=UPI00140AA035|nr:pyridoxamine 5'-phosphate oxidase family protein [Halorubellus sp. JP-L1]NHN41197.1 pyridoxamine 5'-phosphate oxidase family protein [Halorubellus sp. JP-L1]
MGDTDSHRLDDDALDAVLSTGGVGVLAFASGADDPPHSVPVSYGYDAETESLFFRLAVGGDSTKAELLDAPATFTVYREGEDGYESVVAQGQLESIAEEDVDPSVLDGLSRVDIPLFDAFERDTREIQFEFVRLDAADATGKRTLE